MTENWQEFTCAWLGSRSGFYLFEEVCVAPTFLEGGGGGHCLEEPAILVKLLFIEVDYVDIFRQVSGLDKWLKQH